MDAIVTVPFPLVIGSVAIFMGKNADKSASHRWSLYIRGKQHENLENFIDKVIFSIHPSFPKPEREVCSPPYQIFETGWGEFETGVEVFFKDTSYKSVRFRHHLKLFELNSRGKKVESPNPVVSETYEELLFQMPAESYAALAEKHAQSVESAKIEKDTNEAVAALLLSKLPPIDQLREVSEVDKVLSIPNFNAFTMSFCDAVDIEKLQEASAKIQKEIEIVKRELNDYPPQIDSSDGAMEENN